MEKHLEDAFRYHRQRGVAATAALALARADVAAGKARYPSSGRGAPGAWQQDGTGRRGERLYFVEDDDGRPFRVVGAVNPECRRGWLHRPRKADDFTGWYTDPYGESFRDGTGLCWGVVALLPGRDGATRLVAGYQFGGTSGGPTLDLGTVFTAERGSGDRWNTDAADLDAASDAARAADAMAQRAAEEEQNYQRAWQAGSRWAALAEEAAAIRSEILADLGERRQAAKAGLGELYSSLCARIRRDVERSLERFHAIRGQMAELRDGRAEQLYFNRHDSSHVDAFNEGAGKQVIA